MKEIDVLRSLCVPTESKIVLLVMDGLGDLPTDGQTALERAVTPHLDRLALEGACGLTDPVARGITPGSGPSHLSLFGYDPFKYILGRGILEALGVGVLVGPNDMVARGNFATLSEGKITDRRAGRISSERNMELCRLVNSSLQSVRGIAVELTPGKEHRFVVKFSGEDLCDRLSDADPQKENKPPVGTGAQTEEAATAAAVVNAFIEEVTAVLKDQPRANTILLRGFSKHPTIPTFKELYKLKAAAIANYPMYRGLAKLAGMDILDVGPDISDLFDTLDRHYADYDFFYMHVKRTDSAGEDGDMEAKTKAIEKTDGFIPRILHHNPEVLAVTSDHSTPCLMKAHSWHPNPVIIHGRTAMPDTVTFFSERACSHGYLGRFPAVHVMALLLAHAGKLQKYGA
ncbi:MAG: 2,3-bisphosphoglycerate-independent phosphoglycerate mutase [Acidobacteria bacterium]|nr:2,3-bisphosphoglycerate-independent phosphoglycerate mutase [Acidobacteriota bacterium]MBU1338089.1 2,3-bisphosphoglycerate-independent phosphoglycerate mutase [Acidobacteriota bacterium]MBU1474271.1 2,3-bisphosphoglycerate-independent phosphoglycerate mutase [Acidobacteriota bacterium]MBU2438382.1 2,3-bisphosphoglycerate-independent phosphoglycerate mutase [Acidobacteriota bacterium]